MNSRPAAVLCIHDLSALGRAGLSAVVPVLAAFGAQPVALPTMVLSSHTGGLGQPAVMADESYGQKALAQYRALGVEFDYIYSGYLASPAQVELVRTAHACWPGACLVVDPVMGDHGRLYTGIGPEMVQAMKELCAMADLILPNAPEACLLMEKEPAMPGDRQAAGRLAEEVRQATGAKNAVVTGMDMGEKILCAGAGRDAFLVVRNRLHRSFPGTGDLFGAVLIGGPCRGNALSAAAEAAAVFVAEAIAATPADADTRLGVWFEPLLGRLKER